MLHRVQTRLILTAVAIVGAASFLMPFFSVSALMAQRQPLIDYTGLELLTGTTFQQPLRTGDLPKPLAPVLVAWLVFVGVLVAGIASWVPGRYARALALGAALIAALGGILLFEVGEAAIARTIPDHLVAYPLPAVWIPFASAVVLLVCHSSSALAAKRKALAEASAQSHLRN